LPSVNRFRFMPFLSRGMEKPRRSGARLLAVRVLPARSFRLRRCAAGICRQSRSAVAAPYRRVGSGACGPAVAHHGVCQGGYDQDGQDDEDRDAPSRPVVDASCPVWISIEVTRIAHRLPLLLAVSIDANAPEGVEFRIASARLRPVALRPFGTSENGSARRNAWFREKRG
jgi:hypothetical protein